MKRTILTAVSTVATIAATAATAQAVVVNQGDLFHTSTGACTIGYVEAGGAYSAGHCGVSGDTAYEHNTGEALGTFNTSFDPNGSIYTQTDSGYITFNDQTTAGANIFSGDTVLTPDQVNVGDTINIYGGRDQDTRTGEVLGGTSQQYVASPDTAGHPGGSGGPAWIEGKGFVGTYSGTYAPGGNVQASLIDPIQGKAGGTDRNVGEAINTADRDRGQSITGNTPAPAPGPATEGPTTEVPAPVTEDPTTKVPAPVTEDPTTKVPAPVTEDPTTEVPAPVTEDPTTEVPAPVTEEPTTDAPAPATDDTKPDDSDSIVNGVVAAISGAIAAVASFFGSIFAPTPKPVAPSEPQFNHAPAPSETATVPDTEDVKDTEDSKPQKETGKAGKASDIAASEVGGTVVLESGATITTTEDGGTVFTAPTTPADKAGENDPDHDKEAQDNAPRTLASTGANVAVIAIVALIILAAGAILIVRSSRKGKKDEDSLE